MTGPSASYDRGYVHGLNGLPFKPTSCPEFYASGYLAGKQILDERGGKAGAWHKGRTPIRREIKRKR